MKDFSKEIKAYVLRSSIEFGEVDEKKVLTKLFQYGLDKKDIPEVMKEISKSVAHVHVMSAGQKEKEFESLKGIIKERVEKEKTLPELKNVSGKVVTRFAPEPSKYMHLGHAIACLINYTYAKKYNGKFIIRFDDCNPEKVSKEYVDSNLDDLNKYLEVKYDEVKFLSDDMSLFYSYAKDMINKGFAYMCTCEREHMQNLRHDGKECECRKKSNIKVTLEKWDKFLEGFYAPGTAVLRFRGNMSADNQVMRDPVLFRLSDKEHFRQGNKYRVWPMYDFYSAVGDSLLGITHVMRTAEFDLRVELQEEIKKILGLKTQEFVQYGRVNVIGAETQGRTIRESIVNGEYEGWDDPRLMTLKALKRRGISKDVFVELINHIGLAKKQVNIDFAMIASISRKLLDLKVNRYYFVANPVELEIKGMPNIKEVEVKMHPDKPFMRKIRIGNKIIISKADYDSYLGKEVRLMNLFNMRINSKDKAEFTELENNPKIQKIQWVSIGLPVKIKMDDASWLEGMGEQDIANLKIGEVIQFERFGFVRLDKVVNGVYEFWFSHK
ncbi:MAG: glutamate--tRNA ligase [Nanoarchaeota archaeon]